MEILTVIYSGREIISSKVELLKQADSIPESVFVASTEFVYMHTHTHTHTHTRACISLHMNNITCILSGNTIT